MTTALVLSSLFQTVDKPSIVRLIESKSGFQLTRNGKPFYIKGVGGQKNLDELREAGGNAIRTWGIDDKTVELFDRAHKAGIVVQGGFWLAKAGDGGFSYNNPADRQKQFEYIQKYVRKFKNHPALLTWAVGNEMELGLPKDQVENMWMHVDEIAKMMKTEDPGRPVMSVVADMWPEKMGAILKYTTHLDLLGINSYGGLPTLHERMVKWKKPYVITEFQHANPTNGEGQPLNLPVELSSTEKAKVCREHYQKGIAAFPNRVLGSFGFYWDPSVTQISSWYNMHLKTGEKLESVDVLQKQWTGKFPKLRCPQINQTKDLGNRNYEISVSSPSKLPLKYELQVISEDKERFVGDFEMDLGVAWKGEVKPKFALPTDLPSGRYRAYFIARDSKGGAAVWNTVYRLPN